MNFIIVHANIEFIKFQELVKQTMFIQWVYDQKIVFIVGFCL